MKKFYIFILMISIMFCVSCTNDAPIVKGERADEVGDEITNNVGDGVLDVPKVDDDIQNKIDTPQIVASTTPTNYDTSTLSNKKYGWYFNKGTNHGKPRIDTALKKIADKYDAIYLESTDDKVIYLTFDEGYENGYTGKILDTLKEKNVKAVFFITGPYLEKNEDLVRRMVEEGHTVGNHTVNHPSMPDVNDEKLEKELLDLDRKFYELFGQSMKYVRPPMGEFSERTVALSKNLGYTSVFWSFAYKDWETNNQKGTEYAKKTVLDSIHPGEVMLLHAVSVDNTNALGSIIDEARAMGYEFGELK